MGIKWTMKGALGKEEEIVQYRNQSHSSKVLRY
jgi:hypothetical protein